MDLLEVRELEICPWALREGIILRRLDWMDGRNLRKIGEYHRNVDRRAV